MNVNLDSKIQVITKPFFTLKGLSHDELVYLQAAMSAWNLKAAGGVIPISFDNPILEKYKDINLKISRALNDAKIEIQYIDAGEPK